MLYKHSIVDDNKSSDNKINTITMIKAILTTITHIYNNITTATSKPAYLGGV